MADRAMELLSNLEREYVLKTIRDVRLLWAGRGSPFAAGFDLACEEIETRLAAAWGRAPVDRTHHG